MSFVFHTILRVFQMVLRVLQTVLRALEPIFRTHQAILRVVELKLGVVELIFRVIETILRPFQSVLRGRQTALRVIRLILRVAQTVLLVVPAILRVGRAPRPSRSLRQSRFRPHSFVIQSQAISICSPFAGNASPTSMRLTLCVAVIVSKRLNRPGFCREFGHGLLSGRHFGCAPFVEHCNVAGKRWVPILGVNQPFL